MSFELSDRVSKVDAMIVAVSKRVVDMVTMGAFGKSKRLLTAAPTGKIC